MLRVKISKRWQGVENQLYKVLPNIEQWLTPCLGYQHVSTSEIVNQTTNYYTEQTTSRLNDTNTGENVVLHTIIVWKLAVWLYTKVL